MNLTMKGGKQFAVNDPIVVVSLRVRFYSFVIWCHFLLCSYDTNMALLHSGGWILVLFGGSQKWGCKYHWT